MADITSANAVFIISVPDALPVPQQLQGFSTDDIFDADDIAPVEVMMGVDGNLSGGFVFTAKPMSISLMAGSASNTFFDAWQAAQEASTSALVAEGVITLTSLGRAYLCTNGFLTRYKPISDAKKVMQPRRFQITWESIVSAPIGTNG